MIDQISWILEGRIILVKYSGLVGYQEVYSATSKAVEMARSAGKPPCVHLIGDSIDITGYETGMKNIRPMLATFTLLQRKPYLGWNVSLNVNENPTMSFIVSTAASALGVKLGNATTYQEAYEFLRAKDRTLPPDFPTGSGSENAQNAYLSNASQ